MRSIFLLFVLVFFVIPLPLAAEDIRIDRNLLLRLDVPSGWQVTREAPPYLVEETIEHLRHEIEESKKPVSPEKVREVAVRRLSANEAYLCRSATQACLSIDFSPLRPGEAPPSPKAIRNSALYAAEGLAEEEGITQLRQSVRDVALQGASMASRIDAAYRHHGEAKAFTGIVGFTRSHWFYLYFTDPLRDRGDAAAMERTLRSATVLTGAKP